MSAWPPARTRWARSSSLPGTLQAVGVVPRLQPDEHAVLDVGAAVLELVELLSPDDGIEIALALDDLAAAGVVDHGSRH